MKKTYNILLDISTETVTRLIDAKLERDPIQND